MHRSIDWADRIIYTRTYVHVHAHVSCRGSKVITKWPAGRSALKMHKTLSGYTLADASTSWKMADSGRPRIAIVGAGGQWPVGWVMSQRISWEGSGSHDHLRPIQPQWDH